MSNVSLKEQLQAVATQLSSTTSEKTKQSHPNHHHINRNNNNKNHRPEKVTKPKPRWLDYVQYGVELLRAYFPNGFKSMSEVKPLKKGIKQDLVKRLSTMEMIVTEDKACMVKSLTYYVNTSAYHRSVVEGSARIDLDGNPAGIVTAEEAKYSVDRHQAKLKAKQAGASNSQKGKDDNQSHNIHSD